MSPRPEDMWSPGFIAKARRRWDKGLSASKIGAELGVTKNVIIGIAHRNGFSARPSPLGLCMEKEKHAAIIAAREVILSWYDLADCKESPRRNAYNRVAAQ